jgi:hypothetical protein
MGKYVCIAVVYHGTPGSAGGAIPTPRKLNPASESIADPIIRVTMTISGGKQLGAT